MTTEKARYNNGTWVVYYGPNATTGTGGGTTQPTNNPPVAAFTYVPGSGTDSYRVDFDARGSSDSGGTIVKYFWNFGNGVTYETTNPIANGFYYTADGAYNVVLTVTDNLGATGQVSHKLAVTMPVTGPVNQPPNANFTYTANGLTLNFDATSSSDPEGGTLSYAWNYGDNITGSGARPNHTYAAAGTYTVTLTVTDPSGASGTKTSTGTVSPVAATPTQPTGTGITRYQDVAGADFDAHLNAVGTNRLSLQVGTTYAMNGITKATFTTGGFGAVSSKAGGIVGPGVGTILELAPNTMTQNAPTGGTNNFYIAGLSHITNAKLDGFTILGTTQKSLYNGFMFQYCTNPTVSNMLFKNIPGNSASPPGETFYLNFFQNTGTSINLDTVEFDGSNGSTASSGWTAAAMLGTNTYAGRVNLRRVYAHESRYSKSFAAWQTTGGGQLTEVWTVNCAYGIGFENCEGTWYLDNCVFGGNGADIHLGHNNLYGNPSNKAKLIFRNPVFLGGQTQVNVFIPPQYTGANSSANGVNQQNASDVQVLVGSDATGWTNKTSTLLKVTTAYPGSPYNRTPVTGYTKPSWALQK